MHTPTRRQALRSLATTSAAALASQAFAAQRSPKPVNVVLLLADDMGYQDPACFGGTAVKTPHLDALAASGAKMTNFYSGSAVCTPSRASILTGKYPLRFDVRQHFPDDESHLPAGAVTIPKLLQHEGYRTGHVGKWHLGGLHLAHARNREQSIPGPIQHGFDDYQCQIEAPFPRAAMGSGRTLFRQGGTCLLRNDKPVGPEDPYFRQHFTELNGSESLRLMERYHAEETPFFLNLWFLAPHTPYEPAPEPHWSRHRDDAVSHDQRCFRSMVSCLDAQVGRVLAKLDQLGIRENTLVLFTSDNGGAYEADIGPYKGGKTDLHEGGLRVPFIASWPGRIPAGVALPAFGHHTDLLPTVCAATGASAPSSDRLDGRNLLPYLTGGEAPERGTVFWQMDLYRSLQRHSKKPEPFVTEVARRGQWKLTARDGLAQELFDIEADPLEQRNVIQRHPALAAELTAELRDFLNAPRDRSGKPAAKN